MTGQIPDEFLFQGERYAITGINGPTLFNPFDYGIRTRSASTACWRGFQAFYTILNNKLVIENLFLNSKEEKRINGIKPKKKTDFSADEEAPFFGDFTYYYLKLNLELNFTGSLLIAKEFINSMYVHMGFQRPIAYRTVYELTFENGQLVKTVNKSKEMEKRRKDDSQKGANPKSRKEEDIKEWISESFSLSYEKTSED